MSSDKRDTYIWDMDGCIVLHTDNIDPNFKFIPGAINNLTELLLDHRYLILVTGRTQEQAQPVLDELWQRHGVQFQQVLFNLPTGARYLVNDTGADGECKSFAISHKRNSSWVK